MARRTGSRGEGSRGRRSGRRTMVSRLVSPTVARPQRRPSVSLPVRRSGSRRIRGRGGIRSGDQGQAKGGASRSFRSLNRRFRSPLPRSRSRIAATLRRPRAIRMPSRSDVTDSCSGREPSELTSLVESRRAFGLWLGGLVGGAALWGCTETGSSNSAAVVSLLDAVPGRTTLEEFRKQFHVIGVRDNSAAGVVSARGGAAANLDLGPLKLTELTGVFVDGRLFELHGWVRAQGSGRFQELMS